MNLTTPITITFTEQKVLNANLDRENDFIRVKVSMIATDGRTSKHELVLDKFTAAVPAVMAGDVVVTPEIPAKGGRIQRLVVTPVGARTDGQAVIFGVETVATGSNATYQAARQALKQNDEISALEAAGIANGWLMPAT